MQLVAKGKVQGRIRFKLFGKRGHEVLKDKTGKFLQVTCPKVGARDSGEGSAIVRSNAVSVYKQRRARAARARVCMFASVCLRVRVRVCVMIMIRLRHTHNPMHAHCRPLSLLATRVNSPVHLQTRASSTGIAILPAAIEP